MGHEISGLFLISNECLLAYQSDTVYYLERSNSVQRVEEEIFVSFEAQLRTGNILTVPIGWISKM
jgi:hypothetical protein